MLLSPSLFLCWLLAVGAHADHSVSLCLLCRHEAGEETCSSYPFPLTSCLFDSFTRRSSPGANSHWHVCQCRQSFRYSFCQRRRCTLWYNCCSSSLDGSRLAVGAPMHDYSTAEANELRERQWRSNLSLRVRWLGLEPDLVPAGDMAKVWRTLFFVGGWLE
jgi:hypothetical protein